MPQIEQKRIDLRMILLIAIKLDIKGKLSLTVSVIFRFLIASVRICCQVLRSRSSASDTKPGVQFSFSRYVK